MPYRKLRRQVFKKKKKIQQWKSYFPVYHVDVDVDRLSAVMSAYDTTAGLNQFIIQVIGMSDITERDSLQKWLTARMGFRNQVRIEFHNRSRPP